MNNLIFDVPVMRKRQAVCQQVVDAAENSFKLSPIQDDHIPLLMPSKLGAYSCKLGDLTKLERPQEVLKQPPHPLPSCHRHSTQHLD